MSFALQKKVTLSSTLKQDAKSGNILSRVGSELLSSSKKTTAENALIVSECTVSSLRVLSVGVHDSPNEREINPGFEKLSPQTPTSQIGKSARVIMAIMVSQAAR
ncbi:hypothetical protein RN22_03605 [Grimontia sp. AD028]|uniref:hypothetical protein n=1 Tax=Grimontia sp. AD028 TaxID=1581149 RepID=UPI00061AA52B|nr:hypothetical protein [Grimontia sp. AD028]KKD61716.1 hypothetical protein RN22_03605 [Grimontia sp. AD028]